MASRRLDISSLLCDDPPPFSPLDALVHAATEERRRLNTDQPQPPPPPPQPNYERRHPDIVDFHRQQQRAQDLDRRRFDQYEREHRELREYELRKREDAIREERLREEQAREIERRKLDEHLLLQRELEQRRELERREFQRREIERRELAERRDYERRELDRQLAERQQRDAIELDRRRCEQERINDLRHHQQIQLDSRPRYVNAHAPIVTSPHPPSISHLISHSLSPRLADRPHIHPLPTFIPLDPPPIAIPTPSHEDPRPIKKRRYSESPTRPIPDDKERIARERDKMLIGELGYGRTESPVAGPSHPPRRPGSGHDHSRKVAVADLLTVDKERSTSSSASDRDAHRVLSPLGRRSPPGSQIGRAKAARKSDDYLLREPPPQPVEPEHKKPKEEPKIKQEPKPSKPHDTVRSPVVEDLRPKKLVTKEHPPPPPKSQPVASKAQQDDAHEWFLQQFDEEPSPTTSARHEPPRTPSPSHSPVTAVAAAPPTVKSPPPPHRDRALTPVAAAVSLEEELEELVSDPVPSSNTTSTVVKKQDPDIDMEVDLAVTELVETLEADDDIVKHEPKRMEVDVEDELLSLLDDTPKPAPQSLSSASTARRNPPSSAAAPSSSSHGSAPTPSATHSHAHSHSHTVPKQAPHQNRSTSEAPHVSPLLAAVAAAAALSPATAVRHSSTRPTSERGSMPPPASTTGPGKKGVERAGSAVPPAAPQAATAGAAKKKKDSKTSAAKSKNAGAPAAPAAAPAPPPAKKARPPAKSKKGAAASAVDTASAGTATPPASARGPKGPAAGSGPSRKTAPSSTSRSRSASVMPGRASVGPESDAVKADRQEDEESDADPNEDDKLYCVCKTKYDEDRFMIACDRCDEWYHTQCVEMPDLEVDLVDQFICPLCVEKNPHLHLRTTYKARCLYGLRHPDPASTRACHKAARGAFSKYCSDECGIKYMQSRVDNWAKKGGKPEKLWESVKGAEKREGVVCAVEVDEGEDEEAADADAKALALYGCGKMDIDPAAKEEEAEEEMKKSPKSPKQSKEAVPQQKPKPKHPHLKTRVVPPTKSKVARETERLHECLDLVIKQREEIKRGMEIVVWRERLLQLATERAEAVGQCGWDQRLCMDEQEWADAGASALESYEEAIARAEAMKEEGGDGEMEVDGVEEQWWCPGKKVCDRHQGWQTVRLKEVSKEKEKIEEALAKLTTREREMRKRIEDIVDPQNSNNPTSGSNGATQNGTKDTTSHAPLKSSNAKSVVNGHTKSKAAASGDGQKKGKKRKAPAS